MWTATGHGQRAAATSHPRGEPVSGPSGAGQTGISRGERTHHAPGITIGKRAGKAAGEIRSPSRLRGGGAPSLGPERGGQRGQQDQAVTMRPLTRPLLTASGIHRHPSPATIYNCMLLVTQKQGTKQRHVVRGSGSLDAEAAPFRGEPSTWAAGAMRSVPGQKASCHPPSGAPLMRFLAPTTRRTFLRLLRKTRREARAGFPG